MFTCLCDKGALIGSDAIDRGMTSYCGLNPGARYWVHVSLDRGRRTRARHSMRPLLCGRQDMEHKRYCVISGVLFSLVALAHLLRIVFDMPVQVDDLVVPMLVSWVGLIVPAALAYWAFRISR